MLADYDTIDSVTQRPDGTWEVLGTAEAGDWKDPQAIDYLRQKIDSLSIYAIDGKMKKHHPGFTWPPVLIFESVDPIPKDARELLRSIRFQLEADGLDVDLLWRKRVKGAAPPPRSAAVALYEVHYRNGETIH